MNNMNTNVLGDLINRLFSRSGINHDVFSLSNIIIIYFPKTVVCITYRATSQTSI